MIKHYDEKLTPKQAAARIIADKVAGAFYTDTWEHEFEGMTEREKDIVNDQITKYVERIEKLLNTGVGC